MNERKRQKNLSRFIELYNYNNYSPIEYPREISTYLRFKEIFLVSPTGIEPVSQASEARIFPLNYGDRELKILADRIRKNGKMAKK